MNRFRSRVPHPSFFEGWDSAPTACDLSLTAAILPPPLFHHKRPVSTITDLQPPVGDNGDRPVAGSRCARHQEAPRSCPSPHESAHFDNTKMRQSAVKPTAEILRGSQTS